MSPWSARGADVYTSLSCKVWREPPHELLFSSVSPRGQHVYQMERTMTIIAAGGWGFRESKKSGNMASPEEDWLFNTNYQNKHNSARWLSEVKLNFVFMFGILHRSWGRDHSKTWCHMWVFQFLCLKCACAQQRRKLIISPQKSKSDGVQGWDVWKCSCEWLKYGFSAVSGTCLSD